MYGGALHTAAFTMFECGYAPLGRLLPLPRHRRHRRHDRIGDLIFDRKDVLDVTVVYIGPLHHIVVGAPQTRRNAQLVTNALDGSLEDEISRDASSGSSVAP